MVVELTPQQLEELRLGAFTAIDGLWFLEVESRYGFEEALEADLEVWKKYGLVILRRMARMLGIELDPKNPPDLPTVNFLLETISLIDGSECQGEVTPEGEILFRVRRCSWWENLRNSGRHDLVPCEHIDEVIYRHWLQALDPGLDFEITRSLPRGDACCEWVIKRRA
ncbi:MAG: L-2-amino-thiazoline-4-carboxylic acid hydrolase [Actinobacteria bacterium]|nr:L-2-amino-thiazoline-4-carboxylic acid hydrolase [Actinomycetota bacterium]